MAAGSIFAGIFGESYHIKDSHSQVGVILSLGIALLLIFFIGDPFKGLLISQMVLSIQLPFTVFLQVGLTSSRKVMGQYVNTYNVNGLRAAVGKGLPEWLEQEQADVVCIQETKLQPDQYPEEALSALGYKHYLYSAQKKGYSGVAILTKREPDHVEYGMGMEEYDNEGRFIRADFGDISVVSVYHPSGTSGDERQAFKMVWLEKFQEYVTGLRKSRPKLILCGDYNICHEPIDIHDPIRNATNSGFLPEEREWMTRFLNAGFIDTFRLLHPEQQEYTWWSYRFNSRAKNKGWRIDYCMVTEPVRPLLREARILNDAVHSDHCPMLLDIEG